MIHRVVWIFSHDSSAGTEERVSIWALRVPETWRTWRKSPKKKERTDLWFALGHWLLLVPVLVPCFFILCYFIQQTIWTVWIYHIWIVFSAMESQMLHVIMCFYEVFFFPGKTMSWAAGGRVTEPYRTHLLQTPLPYRGFSWHFVGRF